MLFIVVQNNSRYLLMHLILLASSKKEKVVSFFYQFMMKYALANQYATQFILMYKMLLSFIFPHPSSEKGREIHVSFSSLMDI